MDSVVVWEVFLTWVELHPGLASWVQAFGSIVAIGVAIWLSNSESRYRVNAVKEARRQAILRAISIVESARRQLDDSLDTWARSLKTRAISKVLIGSMSEALAPLRSFETDSGADYDICGHVIDARHAMELAVQVLKIDLDEDAGDLDDVHDVYIGSVRDCISKFEAVIAALEERKEARSMWARLFNRIV